MSTKKALREVIDIINEVGMTYIGYSQNKHLTLIVECNGKRRKVFMPTSGSDQKAILARRTFLRKMARELGANTAV